MVEKTLYILRGLPCSGKTTLAKTLEQDLPNCVSFSADDFHYNDKGEYNFKFADIGFAHLTCQDNVTKHMELNTQNIIVHNTSTSEKELKPYILLAEEYDYKIVSLVVENRHGNKNNHNVPERTVKDMEQRLRNSIKLK